MKNQNETDIFWMEKAILFAYQGIKDGEVPVGAVLIKDNKILAGSGNKQISTFDPTGHAEILTIREGGKYKKNYRLPNTTLYVTLEPCTMCYGAIVHSRIQRVVFGAYDRKTGVCGSCLNLANEVFYNHKPDITGGILENKCSKLLTDFFKSKRL